MAISQLCLYVELSTVVVVINDYVLTCCMSYVRDVVCVMCGITSVLCAGFSVCYVCIVAFVMWGFILSYVRDVVSLCAGFSLCYVQFAVTNFVASRRACTHGVAR